MYAARNKGIEKAKCEYLLFLDCGDLLTEGSVEAVLECADERQADIITGRSWRNGDIEYEYDKKLDILATMPQVDAMETALFWSGELGAKAFHRKLFEIHQLRFLDLTAHGERLFIMQAVMKAGKISGCPDLILEKSVMYITDGYSRFETPDYDNLVSASYVLGEIYEIGKAQIIKRTGVCDGDEAYLRELVYMIFQFYIDNFYRRYWYMQERTIRRLKDEFEKYAKLIGRDGFNRLLKNNSDIRLPFVYVDKNEAADEPVFSLFFNLTDEDGYLPFLRSLYAQTYPFFELFVNESRFSSEAFPREFRKMENIRVLPDEKFHAEGRKRAKSRNCLEIRDSKPLDIRVLRETCTSKAPSFLAQYVFSQKRQTLSARKTLKDKGLNLN